MATSVNKSEAGAEQKRFSGSFLLLLILLGGTLAVLCREAFNPYEVFWANDISLGAMMESSSRLPGAIFACWSDFYWIGGPNVAFPPNLSNFAMAVLAPQYFCKFYVPVSALFLGLSAWFFFRQLRFAPIVCVVSGLAAGLNMHFFSNACWGLPQWNICVAMVFIALGILVSPNIRQLWLKAVLAGLSTGMAVMEGFDVGAILSIYVGIFLVFLLLTKKEEPPSQRAGKTLLAGALVVVSALVISLSTIYTLVVTQIQGTGGSGSTPGDKVARWDFITQWSIPKMETLRVIIPGVFGYRMQEFTTSTNKSGAYWGRIAEDPRIEELESHDLESISNAIASLGVGPQPGLAEVFASRQPGQSKLREGLLDQVKSQVQRRHTGNGEYAGVLVCLLAAFGLANAGRKTASPYSDEEQQAVWFWGIAALFSLLAAWGRHGFVYPLIFHLPFLENIRSPMKFMHPLNISLIILAGYGLETLYRRYLAMPVPAPPPAATRPGARPPQSKSNWWQRATVFDRKWILASGLIILAAIAGFAAVNSYYPQIMQYLQHNGFEDPDLASQVARFSVSEVGLFAFFLTLSAVLLVFVVSGALAGRRAIWAWGALCAIMICDLYHSDVPWVRYYNYKEKYSLNPMLELLRNEPWEHRVASRTSPIGPYDLSGDGNFGGVNHWWLENDFPYNDIQSLEIDQAPRMAFIDSSYIGNFVVRNRNDFSPGTRLWQLTNTRYILADASMEPVLNQFGQPPNSFRTVMRMDMGIKPGVTQFEDAGDMTVKTNAQGAQAVLEFTRALPRAKLYSQWQAMDDTTTLQTLASAQFDPEKSVILAKDTPVSQAPASAGADPGTVEISKYDSKNVVLNAEAKTPAVLLLNDHTSDSWKVWIDQKPAKLLRCNYIMQGVSLTPGHHTVEFRYEPPELMLRVSVAALALGFLLGAYAFVAHLTRRPAPDTPLTETAGQAKPRSA